MVPLSACPDQIDRRHVGMSRVDAELIYAASTKRNRWLAPTAIRYCYVQQHWAPVLTS